MHRNPLWIVFIGLLMLVVLGYTGHALVKVWQYIRLDQPTEAQNIQWSVIALNDEAFVPQAHYIFRVQGKSYQGETRWQETYLNRWTAQEAVERLKQHPLSVWFDSSSPETSSLQKNFPLKESTYAILLWFLALYFLGLGYYVKQRFP